MARLLRPANPIRNGVRSSLLSRYRLSPEGAGVAQLYDAIRREYRMFLGISRHLQRADPAPSACRTTDGTAATVCEEPPHGQ